MNFKKLKRDATLLWHSLFRGMAAGDAVIKAPTLNDGTEIQQSIGGGGVFSDMLAQKETQRVVETRDKYYRVFKEADKYDASTITMSIDSDGGLSFGNTDSIRKKTAADYIKHCPVYETSGYILRTIQDNKHIANGVSFEASDVINAASQGIYQYDTTLAIERDNFIPRFEIEKFVTKIVSKDKINDDRSLVDLYIPTTASQFGKIDAILIANITSMMESKNYRSDIVDFKTMEWYSDKAWNSEDICLFRYTDIHLVDINIFDGNFVLSFDCHAESNGEYVPEKYKTAELDEKYASEAPKSDTTDIFAIKRKEGRKVKEIDLTDLGPTTIKLH